MTMNRRIECRSEGCTNEVLFKTLGEAPVDAHGRRTSGGRSPLSPTGRGSPMGSFPRHPNSSIQVSPYCKQHTCVHFHDDERCTHKKPPHDTVCAIHARCPVQNCAQARAQFLDPNFDPLSNAVPRYVRYEVCPDHKCSVQRCNGTRESPRSPFCQAHGCQAEDCANQRQDQRNCCEEHQCKTRGCRTIVEGAYPHCAIHIKCEMNGCGEAKRFSTDKYLAYCANHAACFARRCTATKMDGSPFCEDHTCRERGCLTATSAQPYCVDHRCNEPSCQNSRARTSNPDSEGEFCPLHTCRADKCHEYVGRLSLLCVTHGCSKPKCHQEAIAEALCIDHLKAHYITQGKRHAHAQAHTTRKQINTSPTISRELADDEEEDSDLDLVHDGGGGQHPHPHPHPQPDNHLVHGSSSSHHGSSSSARSQKTLLGGEGGALDRLSYGAGQKRTSSYTEPSRLTEHGGAPSVGSGNGGGNGTGRAADLFIKIPQAEGNASSMSSSAGRPFQQPRVEEGRDEESEGEARW